MKSVFAGLMLLCMAVSAGAADDLARLADEVRATEIAFAKTLADRDVRTFRQRSRRMSSGWRTSRCADRTRC
jgi:hypothetical protein